ncbi:MAG: patatin-like phospholipase family protein [Bacillota bacterium]
MKKELGLALGGGFVRGMAHIGVLKTLEAEGIRPSIVAGTSAGSLVAGLYAAGWSVKEMEDMARSLHADDFLDPRLIRNLWRLAAYEISQRFRATRGKAPPLGVLPGANLTSFINKMFGALRFTELQIPLVVTATDIISGKRVLFTSSSLRRDEFLPLSNPPVAQAVRASCTVPGLFEPVRIGKMLLVDGSVRETVPAEATRWAGARVVVAVDVGAGGGENQSMESLLDILAESWELAMSEGKRKELETYADLVIKPELKAAGRWDFSKCSHYIKAGEQAAQAGLPEISRLLK